MISLLTRTPDRHLQLAPSTFSSKRGSNACMACSTEQLLRAYIDPDIIMLSYFLIYNQNSCEM